MFDFVQERKRLVQVVLALIVLPFALWGVDSYRNSGETVALAKVNGEKIGQQEFDNALNQQRQRIREMAGANFDPAMFDTPEVKKSVLDSLVSQHLLFAEARDAGLVVSEEQMQQIIASVPAFQKDGKFDKAQYVAALRGREMTPAMFEYRVRQDLTTRQLTDSLTQSGYAPNFAADTLIRLNEQQRMVAVAKLDMQAALGQVQLDESAVKAYYDKNSNEFQVAERAKVEFLTLSIDSLLADIAIDDVAIKAYYDEHLAEFGAPEQRQAAHILIAVSKQSSDAEKLAAKAKAELVLKQVQQAPAKFAALAKQYSQDPGSAANGGDLGMFGRGAMVKPFEDSVYSLKVGEVSGLVQSDFGYHIIKLTAIKAAKTQALADVKAAISQRVKFQKASDKFAELAEKFSNTLYEQSDSLKPAADLINGQVQGGVWLSKDKASAAAWNEKVVQAVFSDDVLKNKRNTAAIEIAPNTLMAARVTEYQAASVRPLSEVAAIIRAKLQGEQAKLALVKQGQALLAQLQQGAKAQVTWKPAQSMTRAQHAELSQDAAKVLFSADISKLPAYVGIEDAQQGYVLVRIDSVKDAELGDEAKRGRYAQQIRQITGEEMLTAYLADAKKKADITTKEFAVTEKK
ncbi:MAG: peptidylprolyl isomerase [Sideroxydans sp.]|nr:peptidylprolyl isomerase [Sideroxydans sp.]NOT99904.1 peptidylprolyl isomerase [Sideroxydans sp.]